MFAVAHLIGRGNASGFASVAHLKDQISARSVTSSMLKPSATPKPFLWTSIQIYVKRDLMIIWMATTIDSFRYLSLLFVRDIGDEAHGKLTNWCWFVENWCGLMMNDRLMNDRLMVNDWCGVHNWCGMNNFGSVNCWCWFRDDSLEAMNVISCVVNGSDWTIRLDERVLSLHNATVACLVLLLDVSGVMIGHSIVETLLKIH